MSSYEVISSDLNVMSNISRASVSQQLGTNYGKYSKMTSSIQNSTNHNDFFQYESFRQKTQTVSLVLYQQ